MFNGIVGSFLYLNIYLGYYHT